MRTGVIVLILPFLACAPLTLDEEQEAGQSDSRDTSASPYEGATEMAGEWVGQRGCLGYFDARAEASARDGDLPATCVLTEYTLTMEYDQPGTGWALVEHELQCDAGYPQGDERPITFFSEEPVGDAKACRAWLWPITPP